MLYMQIEEHCSDKHSFISGQEARVLDDDILFQSKVIWLGSEIVNFFSRGVSRPKHEMSSLGHLERNLCVMKEVKL